MYARTCGTFHIFTFQNAATMSFPPTNSRPDMADPMEVFQVMMAQMMGGEMGASSERCGETDWRGLEAAPIFLAAREGNVAKLKKVLEDPEMRMRVNDLDGDKATVLHTVAMNGRGDDPGAIVHARLQMLVPK